MLMVGQNQLVLCPEELARILDQWLHSYTSSVADKGFGPFRVARVSLSPAAATVHLEGPTTTRKNDEE